MARALHVFLDADLRFMHEGLSEMARKQGIKVQDLEPGQLVIFVNAAKNKLKVYAANNVVAYLKLPDKERIDLRVIQKIPEAFQATGKINYDAELKKLIEKQLAPKG